MVNRSLDITLARKVLAETRIEKPKGNIGRTRFSMKLQDGRSTFNSNECYPLTNRYRKILLPITTAPATGMWLLRAQLPLLLLFAGLQRPTVSSQVGHNWGGGLCLINAPIERSPGDLSMTFRHCGIWFHSDTVSFAGEECGKQLFEIVKFFSL